MPKTIRWMLLTALLATATAFGQAPPATQLDAAALYMRAADLAGVDCPSSSSLEWPPYVPFSPEWHATAKAAWDANGDSRQLARQARAAAIANWPHKPDGKPSYLNRSRLLANQLGDAAVYTHLQGNHADAVELLRDTLHLAKLIERQPGVRLVDVLVACGIQALACDRAMIVTAGVALTNDPANTRDLQTVAARQLIDALLDQWTIEERVSPELGPEGAPGWSSPHMDRLFESLNRTDVERHFAAMSLACHLFRFDHKRWPTSADELVPAYLPQIAVDPWGGGKQTLGYVLIKNGLPDGGDRPLVYSRCESKDGMAYRVDVPTSCFYVGDGTERPMGEQKRTGQFRDVTRWTPRAGPKPNPTTAPLR